MAKGMICVPDTSKLPPEAAIDRENCRKYSTKATIGFPLSVGGGASFWGYRFRGDPRTAGLARAAAETPAPHCLDLR